MEKFELLTQQHEMFPSNGPRFQWGYQMLHFYVKKLS